MFDYAIALAEKGHDVETLVEEKKGELADYIPVRVVPELSAENIPDCDLIVATSPKEVRQAHEADKGKVVHFCQGFELIDLEQRISGQVLPPRYEGRGLLHALQIFKKKIGWKKKFKRFDDVYKLPTSLIAITDPMKKQLEERYGRHVDIVRNGVDLETLYPRKNWTPEKFTKERPMKIINIGPIEVTYKGIPTTLKAISAAKEKNIPIDFTRITPILAQKEEKTDLPYKLLVSLPRDKFCETLRECDIYLSNSTEREGFGLPAMEALASGLICILSDITAYRSFSDRRDHCIFVPEGDSAATVKAIEKIYNMQPEEISKMRANALEVASGFSHQKACCEFEQILQKIFNEK